MSSALEASAIAHSYPGPAGGGAVRVLDGCHLRLDAGEIVAVVGPSGSGKSTLLTICGGLLRPSAGQVTLAGKPFSTLGATARAQRRARELGFVFQRFHLLPYLDLRDNLTVTGLGSVDRSGLARRADELLERFGLAARGRHLPGQCSVGEQQRTALARALINRPVAVLADEPTGNLDEQSATRVLDALRDAAAAGAAVLMVTHDPRAAAIAHRRLQLQSGQLQTL
jgi:ABC-type lipoprotein export system ATPase subunit